MSFFANPGSTSTNTTGTPGGAFGTQNTNQPSALFGSTSTSTPNPLQLQPTQPVLFNNNASTSSTTNPTTGLFGSTNANTTGTSGTGGLFGSTNPSGTTGTSLFATPLAPTTTGSSLFGAAPAPGNTTTPLFGTSATNTNTAGGSSLFTNTNAGVQNPLLGGTSTSTNTNTGAAGSSLFGGTNTGAGLFGNPNASTSNTGGGLFANLGTNTGGGGLFGNTSTTAGGAGGIAGNTNTGAMGGGLFGATTNTQQTSNPGMTGGGLFGSTAGANLFGGSKPATGTGLFGSTVNNPLFGGSQQPQQQQQQNQQPSLFGSTAGNPLFGGGSKNLSSQPSVAVNNSMLVSRAPGGPQSQADAQVQYVKLLQSIESIYQSWNPQSKDCRFQHPFYNLVDPRQVGLYGRPPNATNDSVWAKAVKENPDPSCLVPVIAIGFDDLRARVDAQSAQSASHLQKLKDIQSRLEALRTQHAVSNMSRLLRATALQTQLTQRVMHLVQHLHLLIPSIRSSALRSEEEALRGKLEEIEEELRRGRVKGRLNGLWALIGAIDAGSKRNSGNSGPDGEWTVVDEEGLAQIAQILAEQQAGLQHLTKILQKDLTDLGVIMGVKGSNSTGDVHEGGENLWSSTRLVP